MGIAGKIRKVAIGASSIRGLRGLLSGVGAAAEHRRILRMGWNTVVDVGANRGQFSLAARLWNREARIFAFEPLPGPFERCSRLFSGDPKHAVYPVAIGPVETEATIHISAKDDSSSLLPIGKDQIAVFPGTQEVAQRQISVKPLDAVLTADWIQAPSLLKLDVQGYELEALRGCETLLRFFTAIYLETSFRELYSGQSLLADIIPWLNEAGFVLRDIGHVEYDKTGAAIQGDFLFVRESASLS